jgi:hypothetical protein
VVVAVVMVGLTSVAVVRASGSGGDCGGLEHLLFPAVVPAVTVMVRICCSWRAVLAVLKMNVQGLSLSTTRGPGRFFFSAIVSVRPSGRARALSSCQFK